MGYRPSPFLRAESYSCIVHWEEGEQAIMVGGGNSPFADHPGALSLRDIRPQWKLDQHDATSSLASPYGWIGADDDIPLHLAWLPQGLLRTVIGVIVQARVAHAQEMVIVWLPFDEVAGQGMCSI